MKADKDNEKVSQTGKVLLDKLYYTITVETLNIWLVKKPQNFYKVTTAASTEGKRRKQLWALKWETKE